MDYSLQCFLYLVHLYDLVLTNYLQGVLHHETNIFIKGKDATDFCIIGANIDYPAWDVLDGIF